LHPPPGGIKQKYVEPFQDNLQGMTVSTQTTPSHTTEGPRRGMSLVEERREHQKRKWQEEVDRDERRELRWVGETKALRAEITSAL